MGTDQPRTADQRRADALVDLVTGRFLGVAQAGSAAVTVPAPSENPAARPARSRQRRAEILLTVAADTLLGIDDDPADLAGHGPVTAAQARRIAVRDDAVWRRVLTDPTTGALVDLGRQVYRPPAGMADHVRTRHADRCTRPSCGRPATDLDHAVARADLGGTGPANLHPVCSSCHTAKHSGAWTTRVGSDGSITWTTPAGLVATTPAADLRPHPTGPPRQPEQWRAAVDGLAARSVEAGERRRLRLHAGESPIGFADDDRPPF